MIEESIDYRFKVRWFTTLVGRKKNFVILKKCLEDLENVNLTIVDYEMRLGFTSRWILAWKFDRSND